MAEPRVLVLGDSFIRRLRFFLSRDSHHFRVDFKLSHRAFIKWHGVGFTAVKRVKFAKVKRNTSKSRLLVSLSKV